MNHRSLLGCVIVMTLVAWNWVALAPLTVSQNSAHETETNVQAWIQQILDVGREGSGNREVQPALKSLSGQNPQVIPDILNAFTEANPLSQNLLRASIESIAADANDELPIKELQSIIKQPTQFDPRARGLAFDLIQKTDPDTANKLIPTFLNDPNRDLRRLAVAHAIADAKQSIADKQTEPARRQLERALKSALDRDQVAEIVELFKPFDVTIDLAHHFGFITHWQIVGPFDNTNATGFDQTYPPETAPDPTAGPYDGKLGKVDWQEITTDDDYGIVNIAKSLKNYKGSLMYLTTEFRSDKSQPAELRLGTQNAWKIWVNGQLIGGHEEYHRGMIMDQHRLPITLQAGPNRIVMKILQDEQTADWAQSYEFQLRVTDSTGAAIHPHKVEKPGDGN